MNHRGWQITARDGAIVADKEHFRLKFPVELVSPLHSGNYGTSFPALLLPLVYRVREYLDQIEDEFITRRSIGVPEQAFVMHRILETFFAEAYQLGQRDRHQEQALQACRDAYRAGLSDAQDFRRTEPTCRNTGEPEQIVIRGRQVGRQAELERIRQSIEASQHIWAIFPSDNPYTVFRVEPVKEAVAPVPSCRECKYFCGQMHGGNYLHCTVHPFSNDEKALTCPDWEQGGARPELPNLQARMAPDGVQEVRYRGHLLVFYPGRRHANIIFCGVWVGGTAGESALSLALDWVDRHCAEQGVLSVPNREVELHRILEELGDG